MKNTQNTKPTKKKSITYYLILAASLLVIAGVTVGIVFAVRGANVTPPNDIIDGNKPDDGEDKPDEKPDEPDKPIDTSTKYEFIVPVKDVNLSQAHVFGYDKTLDKYHFHEGMDFSLKAGSEVLAAVDGTVKSVSTSDELFGAVITIEHADGVTTVYKFVDPVENLKAGDEVARGTVIAKVAAATGVENADGDHLHFEVFKNNVMQDPDIYLNIISK